MIALVGIGFTAGFYTHRYATKKRVERIRDLVRKEGFAQQLFRFIEATPEQQEKLTPIVEPRAKEIHELFLNFRQERTELMDSLEQEIQPLLTDEQVERLTDFKKQVMRKRKMKNSHPRSKKE